MWCSISKYKCTLQKFERVREELSVSIETITLPKVSFTHQVWSPWGTSCPVYPKGVHQNIRVFPLSTSVLYTSSPWGASCPVSPNYGHVPQVVSGGHESLEPEGKHQESGKETHNLIHSTGPHSISNLECGSVKKADKDASTAFSPWLIVEINWIRIWIKTINFHKISLCNIRKWVKLMTRWDQNIAQFGWRWPKIAKCANWKCKRKWWPAGRRWALANAQH